jgi:hypothetical protein
MSAKVRLVSTVDVRLSGKALGWLEGFNERQSAAAAQGDAVAFAREHDRARRITFGALVAARSRGSNTPPPAGRVTVRPLARARAAGSVRRRGPPSRQGDDPDLEPPRQPGEGGPEWARR